MLIGAWCLRGDIMIVKDDGDDDNDDNLINMVQFISSNYFQATDLDFIWFNWLLLVDKESDKNFV